MRIGYEITDGKCIKKIIKKWLKDLENQRELEARFDCEKIMFKQVKEIDGKYFVVFTVRRGGEDEEIQVYVKDLFGEIPSLFDMALDEGCIEFVLALRISQH